MNNRVITRLFTCNNKYINMTLEEFGNNQVISDYIYKNRDSIPIINVIKVTKEIWCRLDVIIFEYCDGQMEFLPILMDFNKIANPFEVPVGTLINIPDYQYVIEAIQINTVNTQIPGISNSMACIEQNINNSKTNKNNSNNTKSKTIAVPKLNIALNSVNYDSTTGIIKY